MIFPDLRNCARICSAAIVLLPILGLITSGCKRNSGIDPRQPAPEDPRIAAVERNLLIDDRNGSVYFQHGGANHGFQTLLVLHREDGYGAAVMANSNIGARLASEIISSVAEVYGWRGLVERTEPREGSPQSLAAYIIGRYRVVSDVILHVTAVDGRLRARVTGNPPTWLAPVGEPHTFLAQDYGTSYRFTLGEDGRAIAYVNLAVPESEPRPRLVDDVVLPVELLESGQIELALNLYRPIAAEDPNRINNLARRLLESGDPGAALELLKLNTELHPEDANLWDSLGRGHLRLGQEAAAAASFAKVIELMPVYRQGADPELAASLELRATLELQRLSSG